MLLINVFVVKEMHYVLEHSHQHDHHLVELHDDCSPDVHFHSIGFQANCSICDFNYSPNETTRFKQAITPTEVIYILSVFYKSSFISPLANEATFLRGPPAFFAYKNV